MPKELLQERGRIETRMKELITRAETENRDLNAEENQEWDSLVSQDNQLRSRIERQERLAVTRSELDRIVIGDDRDNRPASRVGEMRDDEGEITEETRALAFQAWHMHEARMKLRPQHIEACRKLGFAYDEKEPEFRMAATHDVRRLQSQYQRVHPSLVQRDLNVAGESAIIPQGFVNALEHKLMEIGVLLQVASIVRTETGNDLPWPTSDDTSNEGEQVNEEADTHAAGSTDPTISSVTLKAYKYSSKPIIVSRELIEDSAFNLAEELGLMAGERLGRIVNRRSTTGTGVDQAQGVVTGAQVGHTTVAGQVDEITPEDLIDLLHSLDPAYRGNARFMLNDAIVAKIRKYRDTATGNFIWQPGLQLGIPDRLLGYPVSLNQAMTGTLAANAKPLLFGDFSKVKVRMVRGIRTRHLVELYAKTDQEAFQSFLRADTRILQPAALKSLQMAAA